jgi:phosphatidylglycerophosphatase A
VSRTRLARRFSWVVWVAQGFGVGRIPFAPGTFGSIAGVLWTALLLAGGNMVLFHAGMLAGLAASVWFCGAAEKVLQQTDPGSVVLDEVAALPICFLPWVISRWMLTHAMPDPAELIRGSQLLSTLGLFVLFRVFDIAKPWPVRQSQRLPGGWGVTVDDVLAAVYVALVSLLWVG